MTRLNALIFAAFMMTFAAHAEPVWQKYTLDEGIAVDLPGKPVIETGTYGDFIAKRKTTKIYKIEADKILYQVIVIDFRDRLIDTPNILGEAYNGWAAKGKVTEEFPVRTDNAGKAAYGRFFTIETKEGISKSASIYMYGGMLFFFQTDMLPGSDSGSPEPSRLHYSIQFNTAHDWSAPPPPRKTPQ